MDSNTQNPQPEQKQGFLSKLFGGKQADPATPPPSPIPTAPDPTSAPPAFSGMSDVNPPPLDAISEPIAPNNTPTTPSVSEEPYLPPINNSDATPVLPPEQDIPELTTDPSPTDEVPQADVSKVDEALSALPPMPGMPEDVSSTLTDDEVPQPPADPMVAPTAPPPIPEASASAEDLPPINPPNQ